MKSSHPQKNDEKSEIQRQIERTTGVINEKTRRKIATENEQFAFTFIVFVVIFFVASFHLSNYYLFTILAIIVSLVVATIISFVLTLFVLYPSSKKITTTVAVIVTIVCCYFSYYYINEEEKLAKIKNDNAKIERTEREKRFEEAPFRCNEEQRVAAQNDRNLLISNKIATRDRESSSVVYHWRRNWWLMSEQEQNAAISKVADIEACFSKEGFELPTVYIDYVGNNVAKADRTNGVRVLKRNP